MRTNWKVRFKNPVFIAQLVLAVITPVLAYGGLKIQDLTTWGAVGQMIAGAVMNPYVLGLVAVSVWNAVNDPTTRGIWDSERALTYDAPKAN